MRSDIIPGSNFPDYELPDHTNTLRKLSFLQGSDPMILTLNRGAFCPKDRQHLQQLVPFSRQCAVGFTRLVTITAESLLKSNELRLGLGADWIFLHDEEGIIKQDLEIEEYTDSQNKPMIPHVFILEPELKIYKIYDGYWYWGRPSVAELHQDLREVTRKIRPDWKIDTPQMRSQWEKGNKKDFFPYGKPMPNVLARMANAVDRFE